MFQQLVLTLSNYWALNGKIFHNNATESTKFVFLIALIFTAAQLFLLKTIQLSHNIPLTHH